MELKAGGVALETTGRGGQTKALLRDTGEREHRKKRGRASQEVVDERIKPEERNKSWGKAG